MCCTKQDRKASEPTGWRISMDQLQFYKWQYHGDNRPGVINFAFLCFSFLICKIEGRDTHLCIADPWLLDESCLRTGQLSPNVKVCICFLPLPGKQAIFSFATKQSSYFFSYSMELCSSLGIYLFTLFLERRIWPVAFRYHLGAAKPPQWSVDSCEYIFKQPAPAPIGVWRGTGTSATPYQVHHILPFEQLLSLTLNCMQQWLQLSNLAN